MAKKEQETKSETKKYQITEAFKSISYYAEIDGRAFAIDFERNFKGEPTTRFAGVGDWVGEGNEKEFKQNGADYFEDLTPLQVRELAIAGVIKVGKEDKTLIHG